MFTNFDCSAHFVRNPGELVRTLEILPEYLRTSVRSEVIDYRDWSVPLGRRFRALKLWFVLRSYGVRASQERIAAHIDLARELESWLAAASDFELLVPRSLALLNFRYCPAGVAEDDLERLNSELLARLNDSGELYLTHNRIAGKFAIRFSVGGTWTERHHVERAWAAIQRTARSLP
jgi:aromatic-L-amino-acid decarboxylase